VKILYSRTQFWFGFKAGGSVGHTAGVLKGLAQLGQVEIISNEPIYGVEDIPYQIVKPIVRRWPGEILYNLYFKKCLLSKIVDFKPDFVYHRYHGFSFATARICRRLGVPLVLEFNSSDLWKFEYWSNTGIRDRITKPIKKIILKHIEPFNLKSAYLIVVVSAPLKKSIISSGLSEDRVLVNPNAVDPEKFKPAKEEICLKIKRQLNIPKGKIIIGFSGTFGPWHGIKELAEGILRLNANPVWRRQLFFVLYGDGYLRSTIEHKIASFENVRFTGIIEYECIQDFLSICDILISPHGKTPDGREFFGSPTKLFEYMAMGKAIVASNLGQIGQILEHGKTALLCEPGNVEELLKGIIYLVENPEERFRIAKNTRQKAKEKHTWRQNAERVIQAFEEVKRYGKIKQV